MYFDSHLHFDSFAAEDSLAPLLERAAAERVTAMVAIGGSDAANALAQQLSRQYPGRIYATAGYDRDRAGTSLNPSRVEAYLVDPGVVGVGETGLDYYYSADSAPAQRRLFEQMLHLSAAHTKPVVVHSREADDDTLALLEVLRANWKGPPDRLGVLHCFTGSRRFAGKVLDLGLMISFAGIVTFKNADALRDVAAYVPLDRLLIETDAPYLAPVPCRGKTNEPAFVVHVAEALARLRDLEKEELGRITFANTKALFNIP